MKKKHLYKHAVPVVMVAAVIMGLSAITLNSYNGLGPDSEAVLARSFVSPVMRIRLNPNGFTQVSFDKSASPARSVGSILQPGVAQAGQAASLSLALQAAPTDQ